MNWKNLLSTTRFIVTEEGEIKPIESRVKEEKTENIRSDFDIDIDRVTFCRSFRRLGRKTQVHPFSENDDIHNRLTHSVEVARVGRSIGTGVGVLLKQAGELDPSIKPDQLGDIVQVACLAHDLGNPPFGHTGEDALRAWFSDPKNGVFLDPLEHKEAVDVQTYEGNAHTLRIAINTEVYKGKGGMRLTSASMGALMKYPWISTYNPVTGSDEGSPYGKYCVYQNELPIVREFMKRLGIPLKKGTDGNEVAWGRHPLSYLMEAADDICYALLDLEDAVQMNLIAEKEMREAISELAEVSDWECPSIEERCSRMRGHAIGNAVEAISHTFFNYRDELLKGEFHYKDLINAEIHEEMDASRCKALEDAKKLARAKIYDNSSKVMVGIAAYPCLGNILSLLIPMAYQVIEKRDPRKLGYRDALAWKLMENVINYEKDSHYEAYMKVLDFICSLTDYSAARLAREISGIGLVGPTY